MADEQLQPNEFQTNDRQSSIDRARGDFGTRLDALQNAVGAVNKLRQAIPFIQSAAVYFYSLFGLGATAVIGIGFGLIILLAIGATLIYLNQPGTKAKEGALNGQQYNSQNSIDRRNLLTVQSAAGLISNLQQNIATSRDTNLQLEAASNQIKKSSAIADDKKQPLIDGLKKMADLVKKIQLSSDQGTKNNLTQEFHTQQLHYQFLTSDLLLPGGEKRLHVPWLTQPPKSTTCNYYAAEMAVLYHRYQTSDTDEAKRTYPRELEDTLAAGRTDAPNSCPNNTKSYLDWAAGKAGLTMTAEKVSLAQKNGDKTGPSDSDWQAIKTIVVDQKTPVVIGTNFSSGGSHFVTIVGFSDDGNEVYINDPGKTVAREISDPNELHSSMHLKSDPRWSGGRYPFYYYLKNKP